ncbi:hypothetical protein JMJ77_0014778 [Colletotrichum scovillei]|uniref:Uncharacterized protein n=1 Tax=Colletotrichum scovillei TaxID=1209932 RepID=A0A9P7R0W5_9PEZI|nr:hypothetical protein JMJ77_0014778 [Colletotrichum scovillei]KAG7056391.1 hypothetical protein JMJ78_0000192 [Colletotrichum scovillei]KAG7066319.1 hypothetical protein JMJ76_0000183 [Colletotrichum scovillei]
MICRTSEDDLVKKANISREEYKSEIQLRKKAYRAHALSKGQRSQVRKAMKAIREGIGAALQKASLKKTLPLRQLPKTRGDVIFSYYLLDPDEIDTWTSIQDAEEDSDNALDMDNPFDGSWGVHFWEQDYDSPESITAKAREAIKRTKSFITRKSTLLEGEVTIGRLNIGFVDFLCPRTAGLYNTKSDHSYEGHKVKVQFINDDYLILDLDSTIFANNSGPDSPWPSNVKPVRRFYGVTKTKARSLLDQRTWEGGGTSQEKRTRPLPRDWSTECKLAYAVGARYNHRCSEWDIDV